MTPFSKIESRRLDFGQINFNVYTLTNFLYLDNFQNHNIAISLQKLKTVIKKYFRDNFELTTLQSQLLVGSPSSGKSTATKLALSIVGGAECIHGKFDFI